MKIVTKYIHKCKQCGHEWESASENPRQCWKCWSRRWNKEKKEKERR